MKQGRTVAITLAVVITILQQAPAALAKKAPSGFRYIPEWGVYADPHDVFWHAGIQWRLGVGGWLRLEGGNWVLDPSPPAVILGIPPDRVHCPPGLAKKGCVPPGQRKKYGPPPGRGKHGW
jgi:hypothetical protein